MRPMTRLDAKSRPAMGVERCAARCAGWRPASRRALARSPAPGLKPRPPLPSTWPHARLGGGPIPPPRHAGRGHQAGNRDAHPPPRHTCHPSHLALGVSARRALPSSPGSPAPAGRCGKRPPLDCPRRHAARQRRRRLVRVLTETGPGPVSVPFQFLHTPERPTVSETAIPFAWLFARRAISPMNPARFRAHPDRGRWPDLRIPRLRGDAGDDARIAA